MPPLRASMSSSALNAARRLRGMSAYTTLAPPQHTVVPRGGAACESLEGVDHLVFTGLVWAGRAIMTHTCLVERAWLEPLLPLFEQVDVPRLLGAPRAASGEKRAADAEPAASEDGAAPAPAPPAQRRNDDAAVSAARQRFLDRKKSRG